MMLEMFKERVMFTKGIPDILAIAAGGCKGFCDSQGIPISPEFLNQSLKYVPTAVHAVLGGYLGLCFAISDHYDNKCAQDIVKRTLSGAVTGITETGLAYCVCHTIGSLMK